MPTEVLYAIIGVLLAAVVALTGLWVRAHDQFRHWATAELVLTAKELASMKQSFLDVREDLKRLEETLTAHAKEEMGLHREVLARLSK